MNAFKAMIALELWHLDILSSRLLDTNGLTSQMTNYSPRRDWLSHLYFALYSEVSISHLHL